MSDKRTKEEIALDAERAARLYRGDPDPSVNIHASVERVVDQIEELLMPGEVAAETLGLSRQRIYQMGDQGKLRFAYSLVFGLRMYAKEDVFREARERGILKG